MSMVLRDGPRAIDWIGDVVKVVMIVVVILLCISLSGQAYEIGYAIFYEEAVDDENDAVEIEVTITEGMTVAQIGAMLEDAGLLLDGSVFQYQELFSSSHGQITAGTYTLSTDMTPSDIIVELASNYVEESEEEETVSDSDEEEISSDGDTEEEASEETEETTAETSEEETSADEVSAEEVSSGETSETSE